MTASLRSEPVQLEVARSIRSLAISEWGERRAGMLIGRHAKLESALAKLVRFAEADGTVLLTGETGTGKELFGQAVFLLSPGHRRSFLTVNCAQYCSDQLIASELFGHRRGSFTGAVADHRGIFEEADGGTVFLDEVGELPLPAQAMLLRVLSEGEIVPVGASHAKHVNVRVIAATSRDLNAMVAAGEFRADLYYRLRQLRIQIPPLRERGDDWELIADYYLGRVCGPGKIRKRLSVETVSTLGTYHWPGNVREVRSCVETGFHVSEGELIQLWDLGELLESDARTTQFRNIPFVHVNSFCDRMVHNGENFWDVIHTPFMNRDLNRAEVRAVIDAGLAMAKGSYKRLVSLYGIMESDYLKFMDFLRHHDLKPSR